MKKLLPITILLLANTYVTYTSEKLDTEQLIWNGTVEELEEAIVNGTDVDYVVAHSIYQGPTPIFEAVLSFVNSQDHYSNKAATSFAKVKVLLDQGVPNTINHACYDLYLRLFETISPLGMAIWHYCSNPFSLEDIQAFRAKTVIKELICKGADINEDSCQQVFE